MAGDGEAAQGPGQALIELVLRSDRESYAVGDVPTFYARSSEDCYLTLINVDRAGRALVLFPNEFDQNNQLKAGRELRLPMPESPYKFRLNEQGRETLVGICTQSSRPVAGIRHDFDRLRFTVLGDWDAFVDGALAEQARREEPQRGSASKRRPGKGRGQPEEPPGSIPPERQARTAISYEVR